jgi:hypothetical protein
MDWAKQHFDKLVLIALFLVMIGLVTTFSLHSDKEIMHWFREVANTVLGTLLGLITGKALADKKAE